MTSRALAWRTVTAKPARAALAVTGVTVIGALLFDMLLLSRGLLVSFGDLLERGGYDVRVIASDAPPTLRTPILHATSLAEEIAKLPEVKDVALVRRDRVLASTGTRGSARMTLVAVSKGAERRAWRVVSGDALGGPETTGAPAPLVVSQRFADGFGMPVGSTLRLRALTDGLSAAPAVTCRVVGIVEFELEPDDGLIAATTMSAFDRVRGRAARNDDLNNDAEVVLVASRPESGATAAAAAIAHMRPDLHAYSNDQLVAQFNENGFAYFRQISFVLSSITLTFAFLLVATLLSVSVNQRLHEVAALRALGVGRRRIAATLVWESAWLVGAGGFLSLPIGGLLAMELDAILRRMPGFPDRLHFFVFEPRAALVHLGLLGATAVGAAIYPVWVATRLPIAATLRRETLS
jgi:putative ABC transport system permease protein